MTTAVSPFVSTAEAARLLGCDQSTVRRMVRARELRAERRGRHIKVYRADVDKTYNDGSRDDSELKAALKRARELYAELGVVLARIEA